MHQTTYSQGQAGMANIPTPMLTSQEYPSGTERINELDLVDIIVFIWRWRVLLAISILIGSMGGAGLGFYTPKRLVTSQQIGTWLVTVGTLSADQSLTDQIPFALKSPLAASAFKAMPTDSETLPQSILTALISWHNKLLSNPSQTNPAIEIYGQKAVFRIDAPSDIDGAVLSKNIVAFANLAIDRYNDQIVRPFKNLESNLEAAQLELSKITFEVIRLFESKSTTPTVVSSEILKALVNHSSGQLAKSEIYFLLGGIPDSAPEKQTLLLAFQKAEKIADTESHLVEDYVKRFPPNGPSMAPKLDPSSIIESNFQDSLINDSKRNPIVYSIVGGFLGGLFATFLASIWQFAKANRARIRQGLL